MIQWWCTLLSPLLWVFSSNFFFLSKERKYEWLGRGYAEYVHFSFSIVLVGTWLVWAGGEQIKCNVFLQSGGFVWGFFLHLWWVLCSSQRLSVGRWLRSLWGVLPSCAWMFCLERRTCGFAVFSATDCASGLHGNPCPANAGWKC